MVLWEPKHGKRSVGGQARTFVDLLEADTGVPRDCLPAVMDDRVGWRKRAMRGRPISSSSRSSSSSSVEQQGLDSVGGRVLGSWT